MSLLQKFELTVTKTETFCSNVKRPACSLIPMISYRQLWWFSLKLKQTNWFATGALSQYGEICMFYELFSYLQPRPPYSLHVQACYSWRCNVARDGHNPWDLTQPLRECWGGAGNSTPSLSLLSLTHSQKCENKVNNTTAFMWLQVEKENDCRLSSYVDELEREKFMQKTFSPNEAINNSAMGTSVDEQTLCCCACFY